MMKTIRGLVGRRPRRLAHSFFHILFDFVYPPFCLICKNRLDAEQRFVCDSCWDSFLLVEQPLLPGERLDILHNQPRYFSASVAIYDFSEEIQYLIHLMKYRSLPGLASRFGAAIGRALQEEVLLKDIDLIVPVPLYPSRYRERGFNQAALLTREIGKLTHIPVQENLLKRVRYTGQQAKFNKEERAANVRDAFRVKPDFPLSQHRIALVDDVMTTGNTMNECSKVLRDAGASDIISVSIARI